MMNMCMMIMDTMIVCMMIMCMMILCMIYLTSIEMHDCMSVLPRFKMYSLCSLCCVKEHMAMKVSSSFTVSG